MRTPACPPPALAPAHGVSMDTRVADGQRAAGDGRRGKWALVGCSSVTGETLGEKGRVSGRECSLPAARCVAVGVVAWRWRVWDGGLLRVWQYVRARVVAGLPRPPWAPSLARRGVVARPVGGHAPQTPRGSAWVGGWSQHRWGARRSTWPRPALARALEVIISREREPGCAAAVTPD